MPYLCPLLMDKPANTATSIKHSGKFLGMAEMVGPLDWKANCGFWANRTSGTRGLIPVRWIVTKDVLFSKFHDLKYHEQHITQVRHGNTIPGEIGRLVIQRYIEAPHGPTAILHPLSQSVHDAGALQMHSTLLPATGRNERRYWLPHRHEASKRAIATFQRGRGGFRGNFRGENQASSRASWGQNVSPSISNAFVMTPDLDQKGLPPPAL